MFRLALWRVLGRVFLGRVLGRVLGCLLGALAACLVSAWFSERDAPAQPAFYQATEQEIAGPPGTLIRQEPMPFLGGKAFRILYRSTGMHDEPIAVSGVLVVPLGPPLPGRRPIVAWAHPTTGIVPRCAP